MSLYVLHGVTTATYTPPGGSYPVGVLTGLPDGDTYALEHVIVFGGAPPAAMMAMLREGIEEAWRLGYQRITWRLPHSFAGTVALAEVGRRLGFVEARRDERCAYYVRDRHARPPHRADCRQAMSSPRHHAADSPSPTEATLP